MGQRDAIYRRLFGHHQLLRDLLACAMDPAWLQNLDWASLQAIDTHYVGDRL